MADGIIDLGNLSELDNSFIGGSRSGGGGGGRSSSKTVNFGGGLELLMNDKLKSGNKGGGGGGDGNIDLDDLNELEDELNELSDSINPNKASKSFKSDLFGGSSIKSVSYTHLTLPTNREV